MRRSGPTKAQLEAAIAVAFGKLYWCSSLAEGLGQDGVAEDCRQLMAEVGRIQESLLRPGIRPATLVEHQFAS